MEAVGAGASVLTFVTVAVGTTKVVYETLSAVRDGPANVKKTADAVLQLRFILEQIAQLSHPAADTTLHSDAKSCISDLNIFAAKVVKLQVNPSDRANGRLWKRLKAFVTDKDLVDIRETLSRHSSRLSLRLNASQRRAAGPDSKTFDILCLRANIVLQ